MSARAHADFDFSHDRIAIWLGWTRPDGSIAAVDPMEPTVTERPEGTAHVAAAPSLRMPEDLARALLDALARHFGGTSDTQTLRKDYLAERARVDKMIDHLTSAPRAAQMGA